MWVAIALRHKNYNIIKFSLFFQRGKNVRTSCRLGEILTDHGGGARTTGSIADTLGAVAAAKALAVEDLEESCHAAELVFQCLGVFRQDFEKVSRYWHCDEPRYNWEDMKGLITEKISSDHRQ